MKVIMYLDYFIPTNDLEEEQVDLELRVPVLYNLGLCYYKLENDGEVVNHTSQALEKEPEVCCWINSRY